MSPGTEPNVDHPGGRIAWSALIAYAVASFLTVFTGGVFRGDFEFQVEEFWRAIIPAFILSFLVLRGYTWARWVLAGYSVLNGLTVMILGLTLLYIRPFSALFGLLVAAGFLWCAAVLSASSAAKGFLARKPIGPFRSLLR
jgi:hypothetical protein